MKTAILLITLFTLSMCQEHYDPKLIDKKEIKPISKTKPELKKIDNTALTIEDKIFEKSIQISSIKDYESQQTGVVIAKSFHILEDLFELNYRYPYLDDESYEAFNRYIADKYLNIKKITNQILDDKEMICDVTAGGCERDIKFLDFKVYSLQEDIVSILLYQENYYSGVAHSSYAFECLNFNLDKGEFIKFDDFFITGAESSILKKINEKISNGLRTGDLYYECWELTKEDFETYKNNFVVNEDYIVYYFDDCVVCPSFTGTYYVEISLEEIIGFLNLYNEKPTLG
ncbi:RsiV family protein [Aquimarina agarivorans]|uniref:RsiV family protein n=1 Tax=Aquimarina agarivorans TaxID=980584 RepID=UPI0002F0DF00|nr:DUF3298 domain-containing protein [Aquimarina agarivorans]